MALFRAVTLLLVLTVPLAGCSAFTPSPSDARALSVRNDTLDAIDRVEAYRFTISGRATASRGDRERTATFDGEGAVNHTTRWMYLQASVGDDEDTVFLRGYDYLRACPFSEFVNVEDAWYPTELPRDRPWSAYTQLGGLRPLADVSRVYYLGNETVDGHTVHRIRFVPDLGEWERTWGGVPRASDATVENASVTLRVNASSDLPVDATVRRTKRSDGVPVEEAVTYEYDYGPVHVPRPNETVIGEEACPDL